MNFRTSSWVLCAAFLLLFLAGCGRAPETTVYSVTGTIRKIKLEEKVVVIDHEEIPGYMQAMVMPFSVKDPAVLEGFKAGDRVRFQYHVRGMESWIQDLTRQP